jgi:hypothetical protein
MKRIVAGLALAMLIAAPVSAAAPSYTLAFNGEYEGVYAEQPTLFAAFAVTRTANLDNDPVAWVAVTCPNPGFPSILPVVWGAASSLIGSVDIPVAGGPCSAYLTTKPWHGQGPHDPTVEF